MSKNLGSLTKPSNLNTLDDDDDAPKIKYNNDIRDIRSLRQLEKVNLDCDSPRLKQAMENIGISPEEIQKK